MSSHDTDDVVSLERFIVQADLAAALTARGPNGERAVNLLETAGMMLSTPQQYPAAAEVAQSCCRNALDSILKIAGDDFPGLQSAQKKVTSQAKSVVEAVRANAPDLAERLTALGDAVDALVLEEKEPGGFRVRQVGYLVRERTRRDIGIAEQTAVRASWAKFYRDTSGVLHGSASSLDSARQLWEDLVAAIRQLFLGLPERAERLRELALLANPLEKDAAEVALMTDPRAGDYFFRVAISPHWLKLLPPERLVPDQNRWSASPYLQRLLADDPELVCAWVTTQLEFIDQRGPHAVKMTFHLLREAGMYALPLMWKTAQATDDHGVLLRIANWVGAVSPVERNRRWAQVIEEIFKKTSFTDHETWRCGQLLRMLLETAYPGNAARDDDGKLATGIRYALAHTLGHHLTNNRDTRWAIESVNDLAAVSVDEGRDQFVVLLLGAVLDLARADTAHGVPLHLRVNPLQNALPAEATRERLLAVHLRESYPSDDVALDEFALSTWWSMAIEVIKKALEMKSVRADVFDFLRHVVQVAPSDQRPTVEAALAAGLGPAPGQARIDQWQDDYTSNGEPLPDAWHTVWDLAQILPATLLAPWQPLLRLLEEVTGGPPPGRPEPLWAVETHTWTINGGLTPAPFAQQAAEEGPAAAVETLIRTPIPQDTRDPVSVYGGIISDLVAADPVRWAADPVRVTAVARDPDLRLAYFAALQRAYQDENLAPTSSLAAVAGAAFAHRPTDSTTDPSETDSFQLIICMLLQQAWNADVDLGDITPTALSWLDDHAIAWIRPRTSTPEPINAAMQLGGTALRTMIAWGVHHARAAGNGLPSQVTVRLDQILKSAPDDQALAVIGFCLTQLVNSDPAWAAAHTTDLFALDHRWRPAHTWLRYGTPSPDLLARLKRDDLYTELCAPNNVGVLERVGLALMRDANPLGSARVFLTELTAHDGGSAAVSALLKRLAWMIGHPSTPPPAAERACTVWASALDAALPPIALTGAGHFADAHTIDEHRWLDLTARTIQQQPALDNAPNIAARAAATPSSPEALSIVTAILGVSADAFTTLEVRRHALKLLRTSTSDSLKHDLLRTALINAGEVEAAFPAPDHG
ncbi:hypothetical protein [Streptosporangium sp. V21-05]|uniref:hypothetical protein n=1 Tax=Streptosporangium sp. V21-05 TaxID=3446115 RepID=UPI003F537235